MSKFTRRTSLALAVATAFAIAGPAMAATFTGPGTNGAPENIVYYTVAGGVANLGTTAAGTFSVAIQAPDNLVGRTTGLGVKLILPAGVGFSVSPVVAAGSGLGTGTGGSVVVGSFASSTVIVNVTPNSGGLNLSGPIFTINGFQLTGATALASLGGSIPVTMDIYDPVTTNNLGPPVFGTLAVGVNPISIVTTPSTNPFPIDVGTTGAGNTNGLSKVLFSSTVPPATGAVNGTDVTYFSAGTITGTTVPGAIDASTGAAYAVAATDTLTTSLSTSGGTFGPFSAAGAAVVLSTAACSTSPATLAGAIAASGNAANFAAQTYSSGTTYNVCFEANGSTTLLAGPVNASTVFTHGSITTAGQGGPLSPLAYNGPVDIVYTFNPAGNTNQQSFLRVTNTSSVGGPITITGVDDTGAAAAGQVTFTLAAGASIQLNSTDLENGNATKGLTGALGHGTGKWILTVTGQMPTMEVTNLNRNNGDGTLNNLGTPVSSHYRPGQTP